jgi:hypothetical protein
VTARAEALASLLVLANEIEDPRTQRPGMQRRREWAKKIDRCVKTLTETPEPQENP